MSKKNIVVIGASYSGLFIAHSIAKHIVPKFPGHRLVLINPSPDFYHLVSGPRLLIDGKILPNEKSFLSIAEGFKQYPEGLYQIVTGTVTGVDTGARSLKYSTPSGDTKSIDYHALVFASGGKTSSPLFTSNPSTDETRNALDAFRAALPTARSIVIGGGGPVAVESAGEIAEFLNGTPGWFASKPANPKAVVTVVTSAKKLLPILREDVAGQAEKYLNLVGAEVVYGKKVVSTIPNDAGSTVATVVPKKGEKVKVQMDDGTVLEADIYVPAYGIRPTPTYVPTNLLDSIGYIATNPITLRVDNAGPRVYATGDVSSASPGGVMAIMNMTPVVLTNLKRDLQAALNGKEAPETGKDRALELETRAMQLVPVGRGKGVGQLFGWRVPSFFIWLIKGRDYLTSMTSNYQFGDAVKKEDVWKFE